MNTSNESSVHSSTDILRVTCTTINLVLGVPINGCVLWHVLTGATGMLASEIFTLNLSVCEIIGSFFYLLFLIKEIPLLQIFTKGFLFTGRPLFQTCICVERFIAVVHPVIFLKYKPLRYRVACSALGWLLIIGASVFYMLVLTELKFYVFVGQCLFFMLVMLVCSLAILRALKQPVPGEMGRERDNSLKRRAFTIICLIMVSFLGSYFSYCIAVAIFASRGHLFSDEMKLVLYMCEYISVVSGFVQPLLYLCKKTGKLPCIKPTQGT